MEQFRNFYIEKPFFNRETLKASFNFSLDEKRFFTEEIDFTCDNSEVSNNLDNFDIDVILSHISLAIAISYYKTALCDNIVIKDFSLSLEDELFWKSFYINWLWEYLYSNNLSIKNKFNFIYNSDKILPKINFKTSQKALIPIWWWKDSILSIELFKKAWIDFNTFTFWKDYEMHKIFSSKVGADRLIVHRKMSDELFAMNKEWYYNWHIPITWLIAFVSIFVSYLYWFRYVSLSNEKSADFWNTEYEWIEVNHQWSKSLDFEKQFSSYVERNMSSEYKYFSLLRWFYEARIVKEVCNYKQYFWYFSSCNNNFKIVEKWNTSNKKWCLNCPKCAFVFALFRPYLSDSEVIEIFWWDMYSDPSQENVFRELLGISWIKPFECVWTQEEVIISMFMALDKYDELPFILSIFKKEIVDNHHLDYFKSIESKIFKIYDDDNIPDNIKKITSIYEQ